MKKKIFLACLVALMSTTSVYSYTGECNGGSIVKSTTGATFCMSNKYLNWWSAQAWCQVNGSQIATIYEMCPNWNGNTGSGTCPELKNVAGNYKFLWSATVSGTDNMFAVHAISGEVTNTYTKNLASGYNGYVEMYAFCR